MKRPPKLCRNKHRNFAYITLGGKQIYLGKWGSAEAQAAYDRFLIGWVKSNERQAVDFSPASVGGGVLLVELVAAFIEEYKTRPVRSKSDLNTFLRLGRKIAKMFPDYETDDFRIRDLSTLRESFREEGFERGGEHHEYARTYLNNLVNKTKTIFVWGVGKEMVSAETANRLKYLPPLRRGQTTAPEPKPRQLITPEDYEAVRACLPAYFRDVVELLRLTGMRPSELTNMQLGEIDTSATIWVYTPGHHKTERHGGRRSIPIGERGQAVLREHLEDRNAEEYVFTPSRAMLSKWAEARARRKSPIQPSQAKRDKRRRKRRTAGYNPKFDPGTIGRVVSRACKKAQEAGTLSRPWTPYELRHTAITEVRARLGAEAAQHFAGHSNLNTQRFYDHSALMITTKVAEEIG